MTMHIVNEPRIYSSIINIYAYCQLDHRPRPRYRLWSLITDPRDQSSECPQLLAHTSFSGPGPGRKGVGWFDGRTGRAALFLATLPISPNFQLPIFAAAKFLSETVILVLYQHLTLKRLHCELVALLVALLTIANWLTDVYQSVRRCYMGYMRVTG